jgi:hypothetical protein
METGENMNKARRDKIIIDLLRKRPEGPTLQHRRTMIYKTENIYDSLADKYRDVVVSENIPNFGYSDQELFDLNIHDVSAVRSYLSQLFFEKEEYLITKGQKISLSRKHNRLWQRLKGPVKAILDKGGDGIYCVHQRWSSNKIGHLCAPDKESAQQMANLFYSFVAKDGRLEVKYIRSGDISQLESFNKKLIDQKMKDIERRKREIERISEQIEAKERMISVIQTVQSGQVKATGS